MDSYLAEILGNSLKLYALMTPPGVLSAFLSHTDKMPLAERHLIAFKTSSAIFIMGTMLYVWGSYIFEFFGFTLDAFRIGSGVLLMLTAIDLMSDSEDEAHMRTEGDISVVPLAIPLGLGPASIGAIMVMGAQASDTMAIVVGILSLTVASLSMYLLLRMADAVALLLHATGIAVLSKLTGLILAAIAAQVVFTGVINFLK